MTIFFAHVFKHLLIFFAFAVAIVPLALVQVAVAFIVTIGRFFVNVNDATQEMYEELNKKIEVYGAIRRFKKTVKETVKDI